MCYLNNALYDPDTKFDIIAINKTWLHSESNLSLFEISGYDLCHVDGKGKKVGVNNDYKVSDNLSLTTTDNTEFVTIELKNKQNKTIKSCIYRQHGSDIKILSYTIEELFESKRSNMYLFGDFDINLLNYKDNNDTKHFTDMLFTLGFFYMIDEPTHISTQTTTLIDNIFTCIFDVSNEGGLPLTDMSHHLPVFCASNHSFTPQQDQKMNLIQIRNETNMLLFKEKLNQQDCNSVYVSNDVHEAYDSFLQVLHGLCDECFPTRNIYYIKPQKDKPLIEKSMYKERKGYMLWFKKKQRMQNKDTNPLEIN